MSKVANGIRRGLEEAVAYARGEAKETNARGINRQSHCNIS